MKRLLIVVLAAAFPALAATSLREPMSGLSAFQVLPISAFPSQAAGLSWASEGHVQLLGGVGPMFAMAVTAPHLRVAYSNADLELRDPETENTQASLRRSQFELGTGIAISQLGVGFGSFDLALGADLVRNKLRYDGFGSALKGTWVEPSLEMKLGTNHFTAALRGMVMLESDADLTRDPVLQFGVGSQRENGLQWGFGATIPLHDDREIGVQLGAEKIFSQSLSFRVQGSTLYRKSVSSLALDSARTWIRSGLGLSVGTTLRFRPWLADRDPAWIQAIVDPFQGESISRFIYDWELGAMIQIDALTGRSAAGVTLGRWF